MKRNVAASDYKTARWKACILRVRRLRTQPAEKVIRGAFKPTKLRSKSTESGHRRSGTKTARAFYSVQKDEFSNSILIRCQRVSYDFGITQLNA